jgi:uncharacterized lipoprotein YmbA
MITRTRYLVRIAGLLVACLLLLAGCLSRSAPHVTYFSFLTMAQLDETPALADLPEVILGVGPTTVPDQLKRAQIATRQHGNQFKFDEFNRWVGVLENDLTTVLGENLGQLLSTEKIDFFPFMPHFKPTYRIAVDVIRLDGALDGEAVLTARWAISDATGKELLASGKSDYRQALSEASFAALVKAESQLLAALSKEIAKEIVTLAK